MDKIKEAVQALKESAEKSAIAYFKMQDFTARSFYAGQADAYNEVLKLLSL